MEIFFWENMGYSVLIFFINNILMEILKDLFY